METGSPRGDARRYTAIVRTLLTVPALLLCACHLLLPLEGRRDLSVDGPAPDVARDIGLDLGDVRTDTWLDLLTPFGPPVPVIDTPDADDDPTLTGDLLELCFERGDEDIWCARRADAALPFDPPFVMSDINSPLMEASPELSANGLTLYVASERGDPAALGLLDIWSSTRSDRDAAWGPLKLVPELNSNYHDSGAAPSPSDLAIVLDRGPADRTLFMATRASTTDPWEPPTQIPGIKSGAAPDTTPWIDASHTVLYFSSQRDATTENPEFLNIYVSTRDSPSSAWSTPQRVALNDPSAGVEAADPWLSPDLRTIYFARRPQGGNWDIYYAER